MIYLASKSPSRAQILQDANIEFEQIPFEYDENIVLDGDIYHYPFKIVKNKQKQFKNKYKDLKNVLFADSLVIAGDEIFGKAKSDDEAFYMLNKQSGACVDIVTAMIFDGQNGELLNLSTTRYNFLDFDEGKLNEYVKNKIYIGKAGAMSIEGFNKEFIKSCHGFTSTAMGLNVEILKAYLECL